MRKPQVLSLFSGAGGLDYGFEAAGFEIGVTVEMDRDCCATLRTHLGDRVIHRDIFEVPTDEMLSVCGRRKGEVEVLIGGPPCQPFSKSGFWRTGDAGRLEDPRAATLDAYLRVLEEVTPETMLLENVPGLGYEGKSEGLQLLLDKIDKINQRQGTSYAPKFSVVDACAHGVPQRRQRFVIVASRDGSSFEFPQPTHADPEDGLIAQTLEPYRTAFDAICDVEFDPGEDLALRGKWAKLLPSIPEGMNYLYHTDRGEGLPLFGWRRRYWNFLLKLSKRMPSWTIQAQPGPSVGPFHWDNRRLSVRELSRLQTFPDSIEIVGGRTSAQRQLGNAVPSLMGEVLAREIRTQLLGRRVNSKLPKLLPPKAEHVPEPEPTTEVPQEFLHLVGDHEPHPGTGLGSGALSR
ncbi:MAG: DNA cytosine methyltransferase [Phycisphaeraceae bacterium]|nr:DNA cytosine methyltransferase [Phycisphaeraceae bacterium]MCB9847479.1 DNA cytosine methyltransferase [Phycisphaeraceae bacterium]